MNNTNKWNLIRLIITGFKKLTSYIKGIISLLNKNREGKYSGGVISVGAGILALILLVVMLFIPPFLGVADDGSFSGTMNPAGIYHKGDIYENLYFNYYVKEYISLAAEESISSACTGQQILIYLAKGLDFFFTGDNIFDLRFLALLYGVAYIPGLMLIINQAVYRAKTFTESIVIGLVGVVIFSDIANITYFSSFFTEPVVLISAIYCTGAALALQKNKHNYLYLVVYTFFGIILTTLEKKYAITALFLGMLVVKFILSKKAFIWKVLCYTSVLMLFLSMMFSLAYAPDSFSTSSKYHAMTRGVLFQSTDPVKTLEEFGIDSSFSILADNSSYDQYPLLNPENRELEKGFYDQYSPAEISVYYLKHPAALTAMLDISARAAFNIRRDYSGNYEKTAEMPKMSKSVIWSSWSNFKRNTIPKTIGFLIVLLAAIILLFRKKQVQPAEGYIRESTIPLEVMLVIFFVGLSNALVIISNSGDAEMTKHLYLFSISIDIILYFCFSEVLHKLKVL